MRDRVGSLGRRAVARVRWYGRLLLTFYQAGPIQSMLLLVVVVISGVGPTAFIISSGILVGAIPETVQDGLSSEAGRRLAVSAVAVAVIFALQQIAPELREAVGRTLARRVDALLQRRVMSA